MKKSVKQKKQSRPARNINLKPFADKLQGYPELQRELEKISGQPHPIDTNCWLDTILVGYARAYMDLSQKMILTQNCHHNLPKKDEVLDVRNKLGEQLYQKHSRDTATAKPDQKDQFYTELQEEEQVNFKMTPNLKRITLTAFTSAYWVEMTTILVTIAMVGTLNFSSVFATKEGLDIISSQLRVHHKIVNKEPILFYFGTVWLFGVLSAILMNWVYILMIRMAMRFFSGYTALIFEKLLRVGMTNPFEHGEGSIINYIQNDLMALDTGFAYIKGLLCSLINIPLALALGCYLFGVYFMVIISGILILCYINALILRRIVPIYNRWTQKTDSRLQLLKNVLNNIKFIKIGALENTFFMKLVQKRKEELIQRVYFLNFFGFLEFVIAMGTALIIMAFLLTYFMAGSSFTVGDATALLQIIDLIKVCLFAIPGGLSRMASVVLSSKRIDLFLKARELDAPLVYAKSDPSSPYALEIRNGFFYWDKKLSAEEAHELREKKINSKEKRKGGKRGKDANISVSSESRVSNLRQTLLTAKSDQSGVTENWESTERSFVIENLNFKAERGKLTVIIGKIGSGKSSILNALMGEMRVSDPKRTSIHVNGTVSYQGQNPWLINGTIKDNVLLNKPYDEKKFNWALKYSALELDLKTWDLREMHEVGESGTALSGGQRARISLARCLYQDPEIYILDDIMSALDANVGAFITQETIIKQLRSKTVVLVTHGLQYLKYADYIYIVDQGAILKEGSFEVIRQSELYKKFMELEEWSKAVNKEAEEDQRKENHLAKNKVIIDPFKNPKQRTSYLEKLWSEVSGSEVEGNSSLLQTLQGKKEDRQVGKVSYSIYHLFFKLFGGYWMVFIFFLTSLLYQILLIYASKFFEDWSKNFDKYDKYLYLKLYGLIWIAASFMSIVRQFLKILCTYIVASKTHNLMAFSLLHSRLQSFLDVVPYGQIQNRFSQDIRQIDLSVVTKFYWFMNWVTKVITLLATILLVVSYQLVVLIIVWIIFMARIEYLFMSARREYNRIKAISISPLLNTISDSIKGLTYIRAMKLSGFFRKRMVENTSERVKNKVVDQVLRSWFTMRCELSQKFLILLPAILGILYLWDNIDTGNIGLFFVCVFSMSEAMRETFIEKTDWETALVSVERCQYFNTLQPESLYKGFNYEKEAFGKGGNKRMRNCLQHEKERSKLLRGAVENGGQKKKQRKNLKFERIVTHGAIEFKSVSARYLGANTDTLKNLTFKIQPGEKIGVVGRSGSGKSTIIKLFWKYMTPRKGRILIDGTDIKRSGLKSLRSQITLITQETALFEGTLRENLDPTKFKYSDERLVSTLMELEFNNQSYREKGLNMVLDAEGTNLSQGEKQLVCFARSILEPSKLVLFDEATANIDIKTEEIIQKTVLKKFEDSTMIVVAHRVQTVLECDKIIVMNDGYIQDFGTPQDLLKQEDGFFKQIVEKMKSQ